MPNWCSNTIDISGDQETLKNLKEFVGRPIKRTIEGTVEEIANPIFSLYNIVAPTKDAESRMGDAFKSQGDEDWYHNHINTWGTKWDVCGEDSCWFSESDGSLSYTFDSAWSPPDLAIARLAEIFPTLFIEHKYNETGMGFWGITTYKDGEQFSEDGGEIDHACWAEMGEECPCVEDPEECSYYSDCPNYKEDEDEEMEAEVSA
jgi:hypothetical protein